MWRELWISLASLLRSYTAAHGLNRNSQARVDSDEDTIVVRRGETWLNLERRGAAILWKREDGRRGTMELTEAGRLRDDRGEEEMDFAAESWARELML